MEQNVLKRYNEIHIMLWEEVIKVFNGKKEFNEEVYTRLRMDIERKMLNISSLEWGYEQNEV